MRPAYLFGTASVVDDLDHAPLPALTTPPRHFLECVADQLRRLRDLPEIGCQIDFVFRSSDQV